MSAVIRIPRRPTVSKRINNLENIRFVDMIFLDNATGSAGSSDSCIMQLVCHQVPISLY